MPVLIIFLILISPSAGAVDDAGQSSATTSLADLARQSDLVALAQVKDTDYFMRRGYPVNGSAYLKILIAYKTDRREDLVEVYETGLHENECYFPNPSVIEEGRRYLLFLRRDADNEDRYRGLPEGCALDVLVRSDHRYAVRSPVTGINVADALEQLAVPMSFQDAYALIDDQELPPPQRDALLAAGQIAPHGAGGSQWRYTRGIDLSDFRKLLEIE